VIEHGSNIELIKRLLLGANGARYFISQAEKAGFQLVNHSPTHSMYSKGECRLAMGVLASHGPDAIWFLSLFEKKDLLS
jgi:hypothetical protein